MKAWLFTGAHEPLELIERETPRPGPGEVLLDVRGSGLCHSDVGRMDGTLTPFMPTTVSERASTVELLDCPVVCDDA